CLAVIQCYHPTSSFFFSSRRRHTRLVSDWSSDVCSSDLMLSASALAKNARSHQSAGLIAADTKRIRAAQGRHSAAKSSAAGEARSEERRVGKECRIGWWTND